MDFLLVRPNPVSVGNLSDISAWPDMARALPQRSSVEQLGGAPLGHHISCPQLQRQRIISPLTNYSPDNSNTSYPSASSTPTQTALTNIQMTQSALQEVHPPRSASSFGGKTAAAGPADAPWNLVPYNLPFTGGAGNNRDQTGGGAGPNSSGMFLRSPTPPRQRTNHACEKCRDRKAKCSGARPTCLRCQNRGLPCEYAKERRMRGPNKSQASSSSTATPTQNNPASTHPPNGGNETGPSNSQEVQTSSQQHRREATFNDAPHYNNGMVHANLSQPDLHFLADSYPRPASVSHSRPSAHTASHPFTMQYYPLPHLPQKAGGIYPFHHQPSSASTSLSEPPIATESNFGWGAHVDQVTASTPPIIGAGINHLQRTLNDQTFAGGLHTLGHSILQPQTKLPTDDTGLWCTCNDLGICAVNSDQGGYRVHNLPKEKNFGRGHSHVF